MGVIYRHPSTDLTDFNCNYLNKLLENISKEQKSIFLLGDFKVNLLNYNELNQANKFLNSLASNSLIPAGDITKKNMGALVFGEDKNDCSWGLGGALWPQGVQGDALLKEWVGNPTNNFFFLYKTC